MSIDTRHDGELKHYFRHCEFGPQSPQLEILCGTRSLEVREPSWPPGTVHSTMVRVFDRLLLAEGLPVLGHTLQPGEFYQGRYSEWTQDLVMKDMPDLKGKRQRWLARYDRQCAYGEAGAFLVLAAYYGPFGVQRGLAEGNTHDNTKSWKECEDPEVAVFPLTGIPLPLGRDAATGDAKHHSRVEIIELLRRAKGPEMKTMRTTALGMIRRAHRAYDAAAKLHERLVLGELRYA